MFMENPARFLENPAGYGPGTYIGPAAARDERLLRTIFQWLSKTGLDKKHSSGESLGYYQAIRLAAATALRARGQQIMELRAYYDGKPVQQGTNFTFAKGRYYVWHEPSRQWLNTQVTPAILRKVAKSALEMPPFADVRAAREAEEAEMPRRRRSR